MTTYDEPCPECGGAEGTYWRYSTADSDLWACRCGHEWVITVELPAPTAACEAERERQATEPTP